MPDPYERHSRSRWEWGTPGSRSQERAKATRDDPARSRIPGRKNPDLCKGTHWKGPHDPRIEVNTSGWTGGREECGWSVWSWRSSEPYWWCRHVLICAGCGKNFGGVPMSQCPLYHAVTPAEQAALDAEVTRQDEHRAAWRIRKPVITGPQRYRRKRL